MGLASSIKERRTAELGMRTTTLKTNIEVERSLNLKKKVLRWPRTESSARLLLHLLQPNYFFTRCGMEKKKKDVSIKLLSLQ